MPSPTLRRVQAVAQQIQAQDGPVRAIRMGGGRATDVLLVGFRSGAEAVYRIIPRPDADQLLPRHALLRALADAGAPVLAPVRGVRGVRVLDAEGPTLVETLPMLHGDAFKPLTPEYAARLARAVGRFHRAADAAAPGSALANAMSRLPDQGGFTAATVAAAMAEIRRRRCLFPATLEHVLSDAETRLTALQRLETEAESTPQLGLTHNDFHAGNAMDTGAEDPILIDWDSVGRGWRVMDLLLIGLLPEDASSEARERAAAVLAGYARGSGRTVTPLEREAVRHLRHLRHLVIWAGFLRRAGARGEATLRTVQAGAPIPPEAQETHETWLGLYFEELAK